ncbi:MAG: type IV secretion system DNA-binding domain-containing protein [bacterium]|nr:type IV secretion system DNA-binding domain-containing protein [bacterium]
MANEPQQKTKPISDKQVLLIRFPLVSIEDHIGKFEQLFHNFYYLLKQEPETSKRISLEVVCILNKINFYITAPKANANTIKNMMYSVFPDVEIVMVDRFEDIDKIPSHALGYNMNLSQSEKYSLRTYKVTAPNDPLSPFINIISSTTPQQGVIFQIVIDPMEEELESGESGLFYGASKRSGESIELPKFSSTMRMMYFFPKEQEQSALAHISEVQRAFHEFSAEKTRIIFTQTDNIQQFTKELFSRTAGKQVILTQEEIASLFHIPDPRLKMPAINWILSKRAQPPFNLPTPHNTESDNATFFGLTNFRGMKTEFGIKREDRRRHLYIVGKSGSGKSKLLETLIIDDIRKGKGVCVMDPHGDLIQDIIRYVPEHKVKDIIYFNVSDLEWPIAFNPLENVSNDMKQQVTQGLIEVFRKFFGGDWSPKIEHVFRYTTLAMLDYPKSTIAGMMKMLTNRKFRQKVIPEIKDSVVKHFWANEFSSWSEKFDNEAILPLVNKLGQFLSNHLVRNIVAQPNNKFTFDDVMNNEKILLIELSKGKLGEENAALLGAMLITKVYQTAMERAKLPEAERKEFYLYIDEFQNFATETFENILSESRKYRLLLTLSHQYLAQVPEDIKGTVFGNIGSIIAMRVGADDGAYLTNEFTPIFQTEDFINLAVREMLIKMSVEGHTTQPFSASTSDVPEPTENNNAQAIIDYSRQNYGTPIAEIEKLMAEVYNEEENTHKTGGEEQFEAPIV